MLNSDKEYRKTLWHRVIAVTWPAFIELTMSTLFGMINMIMVGRVSASAIAAIGLTNQPFMLLLAIFSAVNIGTTTLVAWNMGAGNIEKAGAVTRQIIVVNILLGILLSLTGIVFSDKIVLFMGANSDTFKDAARYFQIVASGLVFQALTMGITAALRGVGETKLPMLYNIGSNLLNVFGNYILIYGKLGFPAWGVAGAAVSTTLSRILACMAALYIIYFSKKSKIHISLQGKYAMDFSILKQVFSIGLPAAMEQFILQGGLMLFARTVSSLGTATFAAHQIGISISSLSFSSSMAFGVASTTLVGQSLGAGNKQKAQDFTQIILRLSIMAALTMGIVFLIFPYPLARLFTQDLAVASMSTIAIRLLALTQLGQSTQITLAGTLRGAGDTMYPLYASMLGIWIFRVTGAYIFVKFFHLGLAGAWIAFILDQYTRASVVFFRYRSGKWKDRRVQVRKSPEAEIC